MCNWIPLTTCAAKSTGTESWTVVKPNWSKLNVENVVLHATLGCPILNRFNKVHKCALIRCQGLPGNTNHSLLLGMYLLKSFNICSILLRLKKSAINGAKSLVTPGQPSTHRSLVTPFILSFQTTQLFAWFVWDKLAWNSKTCLDVTTSCSRRCSIFQTWWFYHNQKKKTN